jgi:tRNA-2-methylthio-N6-dimethylallyladenosine synthase
MNRKYSREDYLNLIGRIRAVIPSADITTDVMTGFPGETEDDFEQTLSIIEHVGFTTAFMFAYSTRAETTAAGFSNSIPDNVKKNRLDRIISLQTSITRRIYQDNVGKEAEVLFIKRQSKRDMAWMGQDNGCKRVLLHCDDDLSGMILPVRIVRSSGMTLIAERI